MTAEAAVVLPGLVVFVAAMVWCVMAAAAQIRCTDAARAGARAAARSEALPVVLRTARSAAPDDARVSVERDGPLWRVSVDARLPGPGPLAITVSAHAAAEAEDAGPCSTEDQSRPAGGGSSGEAVGSGEGRP